MWMHLTYDEETASILAIGVTEAARLGRAHSMRYYHDLYMLSSMQTLSTDGW